MPKAIKLPEKYQPWLEARQHYHLNDAQVQMARELGLNPRKLGKQAGEKTEEAETPVADYIQDLYRKRFGKDEPDQVRSLEQLVQEQRQRKIDRKGNPAGPDEPEAD